MPNNNQMDIVDRLQNDIDKTVGKSYDNELMSVSDGFNKAINDALKDFNSSAFDNDGFVKRLKGLELDPDKKTVMNNVLNTLQTDYLSAESLNQSELLLRRDIDNICAQMPAMSDAVYMIRDVIVECNVSTGEISRTHVFENREATDQYEAAVVDVEKRYDLQRAIKNFIIPNTLRAGESYVQITPYSKLFAELEVMHDNATGKYKKKNNKGKQITESDDISGHISLNTSENLKLLTESVSSITQNDLQSIAAIDRSSGGKPTPVGKTPSISDPGLIGLLNNIDVYRSSSVILAESGADGLKELLESELSEHRKSEQTDGNQSYDQFMESLPGVRNASNIFSDIDQDSIDYSKYKSIKGAYIKYLDPLRVVPVRLDRRIIGYYYISTTMDLQTNSAQPNGIVDLSFQSYIRDRNLVGNLASIIIQAFDKKLLERNVALKDEIVEIIMAHKFSEGKLSFIYIPETEICRFAVNEDENGKGHSIIEPSIFPARMYLMNSLYNMLYMLNNNLTRIHYVKSSGIDKNYSAQVQRAMRQFQSRRITIDDIFSYSGVLNKIGGMGEMVLPAGRGDQKAFETDTIEPSTNPINMEFLEQQRREAIAGTRVPTSGLLNYIDEIDFAKTIEVANTRMLSTASTYKIDFNRDLTNMMQTILRCDSSLEEDIISSYRFQFNQAKQQELNITADMIQNFNLQTELIESIYFTKSQLEDENGNATPIRIHLRKELAKLYLAQLNIDKLDEIVDAVKLAAGEDETNSKANAAEIDRKDLNDITEQ